MSAAYDLLQLVSASKDTEDVEWDKNMKIIEKKLKDKL